MLLEQLNCNNKIFKENLKNLQDNMLYYIPWKHLPFYKNLNEMTHQHLDGKNEMK